MRNHTFHPLSLSVVLAWSLLFLTLVSISHANGEDAPVRHSEAGELPPEEEDVVPELDTHHDAAPAETLAVPSDSTLTVRLDRTATAAPIEENHEE